MTLLAAAGRRRSSASFPSPPYNAAAPLTIPTPDDTGHSLHPSVVDMGSAWNGYRYWMAHTPYHNRNTEIENPCIVASHDGLTWVEPAGISNPIDPWPGVGYNSDTELHYDPDGDQMVCYWRDYKGGSNVPDNLVFCASSSTDGVTWTAQQDLIALTFPSSGAVFSPSVWRVGPGDWRVWFISQTGASRMWTADGPLSTSWAGPFNCTFDGTDMGSLTGPWHGDVYRTEDGIYRFILDAPYIATGAGGNIYTASSLDGLAWSDWSLLLEHRPDEWDRRIYRPTMVQESPTVAKVWYSAYGTDNQPRIGYTRIPLDEWPAPPTP